jgi:hypothetical protein
LFSSPCGSTGGRAWLASQLRTGRISAQTAIVPADEICSTGDVPAELTLVTVVTSIGMTGDGKSVTADIVKAIVDKHDQGFNTKTKKK